LKSARRPAGLRCRLLSLALIGIVPFAFLSAVGLGLIFYKQQEITKQRSLEATRFAATLIELELRRSTDLAKALASSPVLLNGQLQDFQALINRILPMMPRWAAFCLTDSDGKEVFRAGPAMPDTQGRPGDTRPFAAAGLLAPTIGPLVALESGVQVIPLRVAATVNGRLVYMLTVGLRPEAFTDVLQTRKLPAGWVTSVFDTSRTRIARTKDATSAVGLPPQPSLIDLLEDPSAEGTGLTLSVEGDEVYTAFVRLEDIGWMVATGIPTQTLRNEAIRSLALYGGGLFLSMLFAVLAALLLTRRIRRPIEALRVAAQAIAKRELPKILETDIKEINELSTSLHKAAQARASMEEDNNHLLSRLERSQSELAQQVEDLEAMQTLNHRLLRMDERDDQLQAILKTLCDIHRAHQGLVSISLDGGPLELVVSTGLSQAARTAIGSVRPGEGACGAAVSSQSRVIIVDTETDPRFERFRHMARSEGFSAVHSTPLASNRFGILGALTIQLPVSRAPTEREIRFADLCASKAALLIERALIQDKALATSAANVRLQEALDSSVVPFAMLMPIQTANARVEDFWVDYVNSAAATWFNFGHGASLKEAFTSRYGPAATKPLLDMCKSVYASRTDATLEMEVDSFGQPRWLNVVAGLFEGGVTLWFADVTVPKQLQASLLEADRRKDQFLAVLAHELRTPLAPIRQAAALLKTRLAEEQQESKSLAIIERQVTHMGHLLNDLLDVSRINFGKIVLKKESVSLHSALSQALETVRPLVSTKRLQVSTNLGSEEILVLADPTRLEQIFVNLLGNAAKYTPERGRIEIATSLKPGTAEVAIQDTGIGLSPEHLDSVFELFNEVKAGEGKRSDGLGIGLALTRDLARLHGGEIYAYSSGLGQGSRFVVSLPWDGSTVELPEKPSREDQNLQARRILVADDHVDIASTLADLLALEGHQVTVAFDGKQAFEAAQNSLPDVALLDIGMPGLTGHEVAAAIRALPGGADVRMIALSGWGGQDDKELALKAGFNQHMTKPVDLDKLLAAVISP
jgi:signal transduction histidine kinase/CheY-like chemotaxis protein/HAMP domain-containing protein